MSGADEARNAIQEAVRGAYKPVFEAGRAFSEAYKPAISTTDVVEAMRRAVSIILTAEHLAAMAAEAKTRVREILGEQMNETGATTIATEGHTAYLSKDAAWVSVDHEDMVPAEYMRQADPAPDKRAIREAIEAGTEVPGCTLVRPNTMRLNIKAKARK